MRCQRGAGVGFSRPALFARAVLTSSMSYKYCGDMRVLIDVNGLTALTVRLAYPTPKDVVDADIEALMICRQSIRHGRSSFEQLQALVDVSCIVDLSF